MSQPQRWSDHGWHWDALDYTLLLERGDLVVAARDILAVGCDIWIAGFGEYKDILGWDDCPFILMISYSDARVRLAYLFGKLDGLVRVFVKVDESCGGLNRNGEVWRLNSLGDLWSTISFNSSYISQTHRIVDQSLCSRYWNSSLGTLSFAL